MKVAVQGIGFAAGAAWAAARAALDGLARMLPLRRVDEALPAGAREAALVASGSFQALDLVHRGRGTATVWRLTDGRSLLRLEGFEVTVGPDLWVVLSEHEEPKTGGQLRGGAYLDVGRVKGIRGNQNYFLSADVSPERFRSIVIYCRAFNVIFNRAQLGTAPGSAPAAAQGN